MRNYIEILKDAIPGITAEDLSARLHEPGMHILDSIIIRAALEAHFEFRIPDNVWAEFVTLADALEFCQNSIFCAKTGRKKISVNRQHKIRFPQMANSALSENWLLKEMGDIHWEMLGLGLEQKSDEFADGAGNRCYAAFVRVNYSINPLSEFKENEPLDFRGTIKRFGDYSYFSRVTGACNTKSINARMMTSFLSRKENDNSQITKTVITEHINHVEELPIIPDFYTEQRLMNKGKINEITTGGYDFKIAEWKIETMVHEINPYFEINAAGLLYFASYPIIADRVVSKVFKSTLGVISFDREYHTTYRDVFYFANCNADDEIIVDLNTLEYIDDNKVKMSVSLYRASDNKLMARVLTVKEKTV